MSGALHVVEADEPVEAEDALAVIPSDDVTADHDCKRPGCPRPAKSSRGRYAFLCPVHIDEARQKGLEAALNAAAGVDPDESAAPGPPQRPRAAPSAPDGRTLADAVKALEKPARRLERSLTARRQARSEAKQAVEEFNAALRAVREVAASLISEP